MSSSPIIAALLMIYWGGLHLDSLGDLVSDKPLMLGRFALPLTLFAVIGVVNAANLCALSGQRSRSRSILGSARRSVRR